MSRRDPGPCLESSLRQEPKNLGSRGAERDVQAEGRHRSGDQDCVWHVKRQKPLGSGRGTQPLVGWSRRKDGRCVDSLGKRSSGKSRPGPAPRRKRALVAENAQKQGLDQV